VKIRFGHVQNPFSAPVSIALERGYLADAGVELELTRFANGSAMSQALARGEVELGVGGHIQTLVAALGGSDQVFIGPLAFERSPDHLPIALLAAAELACGSELEGAVVGVSAVAAISELQLRIYMADERADYDALTLRAIAFADLAEAFVRGEIAAASAPDPFAARLVRDGLAHIVDRGSLSRALKDGERVMIAGLAASRSWVAANEAAAKGVLAAVARAIDDLRSAGAQAPGDGQLPYFDRRLAGADLQTVFDLAYEHGLSDRPADADALILSLD
jgi:ABC-type nitrate/sulfonate/bicarbonate transport system substrate-binding protein